MSDEDIELALQKHKFNQEQNTRRDFKHLLASTGSVEVLLRQQAILSKIKN